MSSPRLSINYPLEIISSIDNLALGTHGNGGKRCLLVNAAGPPVVLLATRAKLERKEVVLGALSSSAPRTLPLHQPELVSETPEIRGGTRVLRPQLRPEEEEEEVNEGTRRRRRMRRRARARWWRGRRRRGERPECALTDSCTAASQRHLLLRAQRARLSSSSSSSSSSSASSP